MSKLPELLQEYSRTALNVGPAGFSRGLSAFRAVTELSQELAQGTAPTTAPGLLRALFEKLGATYIKLGQFIASSPTLFPAEYVEEFSKCLDKTPAVPWEDIEKVLLEDLGRPIDVVFESIDKEPLATASIAQVHTAVLKGSRREVVVKVLKPGVKETLLADLSFIYLAARTLEWLNPELARTSFADIAGDIRTSMMEEVDFTKEARHLEEFTSFLDRLDIQEATAPQVFRGASSRRVLTMERHRGVPLT